jgi:carboxypeptidase T
MQVIVEVRTEDESHRPLGRLLQTPLGLDIWETKGGRLVLRAEEAAVNRISQMGYQVRPIMQVTQHLEAFATAEALAGYHSAASLAEEMKQLAAQHPKVAKIKEIGRSVEGRPILALRIGAGPRGSRKLLFMGCHHAREWIAVEVPFLLAKELIEKANDQRISKWLSEGEIWVVPMVNPDGHEFTRTHDRLWRKNRRKNADGSFGVDPNRNYGYMWGTLNVPTSSHVPSDETYVGPRAFSEPETRAVRDLVAAEQFHGVVTYHSFSQLVLYPWGFTAQAVPDPADRTDLSQTATKICDCIRQVHNVSYTPEQASQLYPTAGDTTDWTYGEYGIPSFTIELRPKTMEEGGFILPASQIVPTFEENRAAAFYLIERWLTPAHAIAAE